MLKRDPGREIRFFAEAAPISPRFREAAQRRLAAGEVAYADRWTTQTVEELLAEIAEECVDIAAWAALTVQALDRAAGITETDRRIAATALLEAARRGCWAWMKVMQARAKVERVGRGSRAS